MLTAASLLGNSQSSICQIMTDEKSKTGSLKVALVTESGAPHLDIYLDCIAEATGVHEAAIADTSGHVFEEAKRKLSGKFGAVPLFTDTDRLFEEYRPDLAIISFPAVDAPAAIEAALKHGCHVLAEKPACARLEEFERLAKIAHEHRLNLMLAMATRMNPLITKAKDLIQGGSLGKLYGANMYFLADQTRLRGKVYQQSWMASKQTAGGGHLIWLGIHYLDAIQFITGQRISRICGFIENAGGEPMDVEDSASVAMQFDRGLLATLQSGYYLDRSYQSQIRVWGSEGWLNIDLVAAAPLQWYSNRSGQIENFEAAPDGQSNAYPHFIQAVINSLRQGTTPPITAEESLQTLNAVFGLYRAAASHYEQQLE